MTDAPTLFSASQRIEWNWDVFLCCSFSLGSLGSEDDEEELRARNRERSADSDGHVKPIGKILLAGVRTQTIETVTLDASWPSHLCWELWLGTATLIHGNLHAQLRMYLWHTWLCWVGLISRCKIFFCSSSAVLGRFVHKPMRFSS